MALQAPLDCYGYLNGVNSDILSSFGELLLFLPVKGGFFLDPGIPGHIAPVRVHRPGW